MTSGPRTAYSIFTMFGFRFCGVISLPSAPAALLANVGVPFGLDMVKMLRVCGAVAARAAAGDALGWATTSALKRRRFGWWWWRSVLLLLPLPTVVLVGLESLTAAEPVLGSNNNRVAIVVVLVRCIVCCLYRIEYRSC